MTFVGASFSAVMGFVFSIVLARALGADGAGSVLQAIATFTIVLSIGKLGMDTTAVWLLPRLWATDPLAVRMACVALLVPPVVASVLLLAMMALARGQGWLDLGSEVSDAIIAAAIFLPAGSVAAVGLAATRGLGGVLPFNAINNIAVPLSRPVIVAAVTAAGGGAVTAAAGWSAPLVAAALAAVAILAMQVRRVEAAASGRPGRYRPSRQLMRKILGYSLPRTVASALEQSLVWIDVLLVGLIAGVAAAGVYGSVSRFVTAGVIVSTALRIVVAPRMSELLRQDRRDDVQQLYTVTACWIVLFGSPIYVLLATFSPAVLSWLGPGFAAGRDSLIVLCGGMLVVLAAGNVQSLLLMSGHSGWSAVNKIVVLLGNVVGNLLAVPHFGIEGAAVTWALCMAADTMLASWQVSRFTGVRLAISPIATALGVAAVCSIVPAGASIVVLGNTTAGLVAAVVLTGVLLLAYCLVDRQRFHLDELLPRARGRRHREP